MKILFLSIFSISMITLAKTDNVFEQNKKNIFTGLLQSSFHYFQPVIREAYKQDKPSIPILVQDSRLSKEEERFLHHRNKMVQKAFEQQLGIETPLRIGICCSGGGNRAMIGTLGLLLGAARTGILDMSLYLSGLSGSTWCISAYSYAVARENEKSSIEILEEMKNFYKNTLHDYSMLHLKDIYLPPLISFESTEDVCLELVKRLSFEQPLSLVNLFGALVSDYALRILGDKRLSLTWSSLSSITQQGKIPLPLCASIYEKEGAGYGWFEMSPFQSGSPDFGYIPTQYLGAQFKHGHLNYEEIAAEYPISFFLGMYGSAFAVTIQDIFKVQKSKKRTMTILKSMDLSSKGFFLNFGSAHIWQNKVIQTIIKKMIRELVFERKDFVYAQFANFAHEQAHDSYYAQKEVIGLFDAGIALEYPLPLLMDRKERKLDIIFLYASFPGCKSYLESLAHYCKDSGGAFPDISYLSDELLQKEPYVILNHPDEPDYDQFLPTYICLATNGIDLYQSPYITLNFKYSAEQIDFLSNKIEQLMIEHHKTFKEIFIKVAQKKYKTIASFKKEF